MADSWYSVDYRVSADEADALIEALSVADHEGTELDTLRKSSDETVVVRAYFSEKPSLEAVDSSVRAAFSAQSDLGASES